MANEHFDAIHVWLGIPPSEQPPNHYRLLSIEPFEDNPEVIASAADRQMAHLRTFQTGRNSALSQTLLNKVAAAKICLLVEEKKVEYDRLLRAQLAARAAASETRRSESVATTDDVRAIRVAPAKGRSGPNPAAGAVGRRRGKFVRDLLATAAIAGMILCVFGAMWLSFAGTVAIGPNRAKPTDDRQRRAAALPERASVEPPLVVAPDISPDSPDLPVDLPADLPFDLPTPLIDEQRGPPEVVVPPDVKPETPSNPVAAPSYGSRAIAPKPEDVAEPTRHDLEQTTPEVEAKRPVPSDATQRRIAEQLEGLYPSEAAKTHEEKLALAKRLADEVELVKDNADERYVLLHSAARRAGEGGDAIWMVDLVATIGEEFDIDVVDVKREMLEAASRRVAGSEEASSLAVALWRTVDEAAAESRYDVALPLAKLACRVGRRCSSKELKADLDQCLADVERLHKQWQAARQAMATLEDEPNNQKASLAVGRWHCFVRGDWQRGLPWLAKGADRQLASLAAREIREPPDNPDEQLALADAWWELAQQRKGKDRDALLLRASHWYHRCSLDLPAGLSSLKVQRRLEELVKIEPPHASGRPGKRPPAKR